MRTLYSSIFLSVGEKMIREYLKENILLTDGAMGTYYAQLTGDYEKACELANVDDVKTIKKIHERYIAAGAKLIRTNTFSANALEVEPEQKREIIVKGYEIAKETVGIQEVFIGASIAQASQLEEYQFVVDVFLEQGADIFVFETLCNDKFLKEIATYIKQKNKNAFIITQFAVATDGFTKEGISIKKIVSQIKKIKEIDCYGFNCASGPTHLLEMMKSITIGDDLVSVLPNAGYPERIGNRNIFVDNPDYFAKKIQEFKNVGVKIIGGCCGTTPAHIQKIFEGLHTKANTSYTKTTLKVENIPLVEKIPNYFYDKLVNNKFPIAAELSPPFDISIQKMLEGAKHYEHNGFDLITVPDSPMSRVRVDSAMTALKIKREIGIDAMPHICCRDKNINALRSMILGSYIDGIRNILVITGDPVADAGIKGVFNLNSYRLIELISEMNNELFAHDKIKIGAALNLNVINIEAQMGRMLKKMEMGADFFLTQPIYDDSAIENLINLKSKYDVKILGGILPVVSYKNAQFLNNELSGVNIPPKYLDLFHLEMSREEGEAVGVSMAVEIAKKIKPFVDGFYLLTPFKRVEMITDIYEKIG